MGSGDRDDMARNRAMKHVSGVSAIREVDYLPVAVGYLHFMVIGYSGWCDLAEGILDKRRQNIK